MHDVIGMAGILLGIPGIVAALGMAAESSIRREAREREGRQS